MAADWITLDNPAPLTDSPNIISFVRFNGGTLLTYAYTLGKVFFLSMAKHNISPAKEAPIGPCHT